MSLDESKLALLNTFPEISPNAAKALDLLNQDPVDFDKLDQVFKLEIGLSARLLRIANSPFYGVSREILSLKDAFVVLGIYSIRNIVMTATVSELVEADSNAPIANDIIWGHCIAVSCAAKKIAQLVKYEDPEAACMTGLLHEVGRMALNSHMQVDYQPVVAKAKQQQIPLLAVEKELLGFGHNELGAKLMDKWKLPAFLEEAILNYYQPPINDNLLAQIVHLANILAYKIGYGKEIEVSEPPLKQEVLDNLGINMDQLLAMKDELISMSKEAMAILD